MTFMEWCLIVSRVHMAGILGGFSFLGLARVMGIDGWPFAAIGCIGGMVLGFFLFRKAQ